MKTDITILIPNDETGRRWLLFQKHYDAFVALEQAGVFGIQYGKAVLNFNAGLLQNITKEEVVYKRTAVSTPRFGTTA